MAGERLEDVQGSPSRFHRPLSEGGARGEVLWSFSPAFAMLNLQHRTSRAAWSSLGVSVILWPALDMQVPVQVDLTCM